MSILWYIFEEKLLLLFMFTDPGYNYGLNNIIHWLATGSLLEADVFWNFSSTIILSWAHKSCSEHISEPFYYEKQIASCNFDSFFNLKKEKIFSKKKEGILCSSSSNRLLSLVSQWVRIPLLRARGLRFRNNGDYCCRIYGPLQISHLSPSKLPYFYINWKNFAHILRRIHYINVIINLKS